MTPRSRRPPAVAFPRPSLRGNDGSLEEFLLPSRKDVRSLRGRNDGGATNPTLHAGRMAMLYVMLLSWKPGLGRDQMDRALTRRSQWQYPRGVSLLGEYWLAASSPAVLSVFQASDYGPIFEISLTWGDVFDITVVPATTPEEGLRMGAEILQRRPT